MYQLMNENEEECRRFFDTLSTGHKLVLNLVTQLIANLQPKSLVIFDEPESHLHPSLLSVLLKAIHFLLDDTDSFCTFATHSPVVLQETPGKQVLILRRNGRTSTVEQPDATSLGKALRRGKAKAIRNRLNAIIERYDEYVARAPLLSGLPQLLVDQEEAALLRSLFDRMEPRRSLWPLRSALMGRARTCTMCRIFGGISIGPLLAKRKLSGVFNLFQKPDPLMR